MGGNSDNFKCILGTLETIFHGFMVKELSVWSGDHKVGQKRLIFTIFQTATTRELSVTETLKVGLPLGLKRSKIRWVKWD